MGISTALLTGWAEHLAAAGVGTWRPDGSAYTSGETAVVLGDLPPSPDRVIALRCYRVAHTGTVDETWAVQVRCRGVPGVSTDVDDLADAVSNLMHYAEPGHLGTVAVQLVWHEIGPVPMGEDANLRSERADTYYQHLTNPSPNLHP